MESLIEDLRKIDTSSGSAVVRGLEKSTILLQLKHVLKDDNDLHSSKGGFRRVGGYQALNSIFKAFRMDSKDADEKVQPRGFLQALTQLLGVLGASLEGHTGNQRYFRTRLQGNGWDELRSTFERAYDLCTADNSTSFLVEDYFGLLLASASGEEMMSNAYSMVEKNFGDAFAESEQPSEDLLASVDKSLKASLTAATNLVQPEFLTLLVA
ncbi:MAG: hypothetical protein M1823_007090, partial [Watsoniomyces obsoletus]